MRQVNLLSHLHDSLTEQGHRLIDPRGVHRGR